MAKGKFPANLFKGKETSAEESAEKKAFPGKAAYKKAEARFEPGMKCGGSTKKYAKGGGIESRGKTRGKVY